MLKQILMIILLLGCIPVVSGAQIQGKVYDSYLNLVNSAVVRINTYPVQTRVVKDTYTFNVPVGSYILEATSNGYKIIQEVNIKQEGSYVIDLILFPSFEDEEELLDYDVDFKNAYTNGISYWWLIVLVLIIISFLVYFFKFKKKKGKGIVMDEFPEKVLGFIKKKGGRITQKEIRKEFPLSEAKISLVVAELEHKGKLKKIKKGRGNIIILK